MTASKHPLRIVIKRLCFLLLSLYLASLGLWIAGNQRSYLDSTQSFLLGVLRWDALILGFFSLAGLVTVLVLPSGKPRGASGKLAGLAGIIGYLLLLVLAAFGSLFGSALIVLSSGLP
jgi:hypothetical protein